MNKLSLNDIPRGSLKGLKVIMRVDYNVPLDKKTNEITNPQRVTESLPTIHRLLEEGVQTITLMSHLVCLNRRREGKKKIN